MRGLEQIPWLYDLGLAVLERGKLGRWRRWLVEGTRGRTLELGAGTGAVRNRKTTMTTARPATAAVPKWTAAPSRTSDAPSVAAFDVADMSR